MHNSQFESFDKTSCFISGFMIKSRVVQKPMEIDKNVFFYIEYAKENVE